MKGNYLVLDDNLIKLFNEKYSFTETSDGLITRANGYGRSVFHPFNEAFQVILELDTKKYTLRITPKALALWKNNEDIKSKYSVIEVQNTINNLMVRSQNITDSMILDEFVK